ncbi:MAG: cation-transporting P-type ATPase, partial [Deltaproteobacteria bacterium]|nr:cation-transporting P-type ATPase [Deltaproteobacteria bacterium]
VQTVCLDKTGTLTRNRMTVTRIFSGMRRIDVRDGRFTEGKVRVNALDLEELRQLLCVCVLCNESKINGASPDCVLRGSPTENALIHAAMRAGINVVELRRSYPMLSVDHRAENRLFMTSLHRSSDPGHRLYAVKGSPQEVLAQCMWHMNKGERAPLTELERLKIEVENDRMAGEALRVLGVASAILEDGKGKADCEKWTWLGLVGMEDPIREGAGDLIEVYHRAGIDTVMITGDQSPTAFTVGNRLNLSRGENLEILDSSALTAVQPEVLQALAQKVHVYSRVSPSNKLQIVQALQRVGRVVAMTGDGINDGPALKAADIGIAMGEGGTDVAREVADVVLEQDDLETLIVAVRDGRATYDNIRKSVHFFLSTNFTEIMVMFASMAAGIGFPLNVMQLLWINIISDIFPGLALSMEAPEPDILDRPPRDPHRPLLSAGDYKRMTLESATISAGALGAYAYGLLRYGMGARAGSLAFHSLTVGQLLHALSCRSEKRGLLERNAPPSNPYLTTALAGSLGLQALTVLVPGLRSLLGLTPIGLLDAAVTGAGALLALFVNEATKGKKVEP